MFVVYASEAIHELNILRRVDKNDCVQLENGNKANVQQN